MSTASPWSATISTFSPRTIATGCFFGPRSRHCSEPSLCLGGDVPSLSPRSSAAAIGPHRRRSLSEHRHRLAIAGALGQDVVPQPFGLGMVAALGGQDRQVAPGPMTVDSLVDAAKLVGPA